MSDGEDLLADDHNLSDYDLGSDEEDRLLADDDAHSVPSAYVPVNRRVPVVCQPDQIVQHAEPAAVSYKENAQIPHAEPERAFVPPESFAEVAPAATTGAHRRAIEERPAPEGACEDGFNKYGERVFEPAAEAPISPAVDLAPSVVVPRDNAEVPLKAPAPAGNGPRTESRSWRKPHFQPRFQNNPYRRAHPRNGDFQQRPQFQPPPNRPPMQPDFVMNQRPSGPRRPMRPMVHPEGPSMGPRGPPIGPRGPPVSRGPPALPQGPPQPFQRPPMIERPPFQDQFHQERFPVFHPAQPPPPGDFIVERPSFPPERPIFAPERAISRPNFPPERSSVRPNFSERPAFRGQQQFSRPPPGFGPNLDPMTPLEGPNAPPLPQITIVQAVPTRRVEFPTFPPNNQPQKVDLPPPPGESVGREQDVRMLPLQLPPKLPFAGKKVLINPHFKGNIQPPIDGLANYIPTRIKRPPSPPFEKAPAPSIADIDDAAERFIAEQRSALARNAQRRPRSPPRYKNDITVQLENERCDADRDRELLRRQEEFIHANRAGLQRRLRSPTPPPRRRRTPPPLIRRTPPPSSRRTPPPFGRRTPPPLGRRTPPSPSSPDEESEYRRKMRDQEYLRERVLRAKEVRRRKNAVVLQKQIDDREREERERDLDRPQVDNQRNARDPSPPRYARNRSPEDGRLSPQPVRRQEKPQPQSIREEKPIGVEPRINAQPKYEQLEAPKKTEVPKKTEEKFVSKKIEAAVPKKSEDKIVPKKVEEKVVMRKTEEKVVAKKAEEKFVAKKAEEKIVTKKAEEKIVKPEEKVVAKKVEEKIVNRTKAPVATREFERDFTPPLPSSSEAVKPGKPGTIDFDDDDSLDLILDELDTFLSDDEDDTGRFQEKLKPAKEEPKAAPKQDLRSRLPPKEVKERPPRQKIVFEDDRKRRDKTPSKRPAAADERTREVPKKQKPAKVEPVKREAESPAKPPKQKASILSRVGDKEEKAEPPESKTAAPTRRVVLQRKATSARPPEKAVSSRAEKEEKSPSKPASLFSRAVRGIGEREREPRRANRQSCEDETRVEFESESEEEERVEGETLIANVSNLPHGMTGMRLQALAGGDVQSLSLDVEKRTARIAFASHAAAHTFCKKFNNKMVAASRLQVLLK